MQDVYISFNFRYIEILQSNLLNICALIYQPKIVTISNIKIFIIYLPNFQRAPNNVQPCQNNTDQHCQNWALYKESLLRLILRTTCESQIGRFERWYDIHTSKILFFISLQKKYFLIWSYETFFKLHPNMIDIFIFCKWRFSTEA